VIATRRGNTGISPSEVGNSTEAKGRMERIRLSGAPARRPVLGGPAFDR